MSEQYLRKIGLIVSSGARALDLSALRIVFHTFAPDIDMPPTALIYVYNLSDQTAQQIQNEFQQVSLQAGYEGGRYGVIFQGSIVRVRKGRESNINTFVELMCSDLDSWFNYGVVNTTVAAGASSPTQLITAAQQSSNMYLQGLGVTPSPQQLQIGTLSDSLNTGGTLPRGKVLFGLGRDRMYDLAKTQGVSWSIVDGKLQFIALDGYAPGEAVEINAATGMIGVPEATVNGIEVKCLINPLIKTGTQIKLNNADITTTRNVGANVQGQQVPVGFPNVTGVQFYASLSADGFYKVLVVENVGDSRGQPWYSDLICLNIDHAAGSVAPFATQGTKATF